MILRYSDGQWRGSLVNEFGVKAFDFIATSGKCRLMNTVAFIDKWYIRRTIENDLSYLLWQSTASGKRLEQASEENTILYNDKRNIRYNFHKLN
jgi:hypothetical protein